MKLSWLFPLQRKLIFRDAPEESNYKTMRTIKTPHIHLHLADLLSPDIRGAS